MAKRTKSVKSTVLSGFLSDEEVDLWVVGGVPMEEGPELEGSPWPFVEGGVPG